MEDSPSKIAIFFSKLFSTLILKNELVSTVLYSIVLQLEAFKEQLDADTNEDI